MVRKKASGVNGRKKINKEDVEVIKQWTLAGRNQTLNLRRVNIFIGLNGSGKMDLMEELQHLSQCVLMTNKTTGFPVLLIYPEHKRDYNEIHNACNAIKYSNRQHVILTHNRDIINAFELEDLFIVEKDKIYCHDNNFNAIEKFAFTGLNNYDFYRMEFYKAYESIKYPDSTK